MKSREESPPPAEIDSQAEPAIDAEAARELWRTVDRLGIGFIRVAHESGTIESGNPAMARMFGFASAAEAIGTSVGERYEDPKERAEAAARIYAHPNLARDGYIRFEAKRFRKDTGAPVDVLMSIVPTFDPQGKVQTAHLLLENIGDRQRADKAFRTSEERFRVLFETSALGMALTDPDGKIARVNAAFCRFLACEEADVRGHHLLDFVHPEDLDQTRHYLAPLGEAAARTRPSDAEWRFIRGDGATVWGRISSSWLAEDGVAHSRVVSVDDITAHKELEAFLLRRDKLEAVGLLAGGIAHDFNNILAVLMGNVSLAKTMPQVTADIREVLTEAELAIARARDLTRQLITFAKGGSPVKEIIALDGIAHQTAAMCMLGSNVSIAIDIDPDLSAVEVDPGQIGQVLQNLFLNAAEAMPQGGTVQVRMRKTSIRSHKALSSGRYVCVDVMDSGVGIAEEHLARIFDAYFSTKRRGSGLGLATAQSVIRRHGGYIEASSVPGTGTTLTFLLPACELVASAPPAPLASPVTTPLGRQRILVMDDESAIRTMMARGLEVLGVEVVAVADGEHAIAAHRQAMADGQPFSLVILDLTIRGGMGGVEALAHLRAFDPGVLAIVASGYSADAAMAGHRAYGFAGMLAKPFSLAQLAHAVRTVLAGNG